MKKIILLLLSLCCICSVFAQTDSLLKKYRNMALEYNHDLKAAEDDSTDKEFRATTCNTELQFP